MTIHDQILPAETLAAGEPAWTLSNRIRRLGRRIVTWVDTCADYYAAAAMYEQLSRLSDAELARRGLSRATLAHDVRATCDGRFETLSKPARLKQNLATRWETVRCPWKRSHWRSSRHATAFAWSPMSRRSSRRPPTRTGRPRSRSRRGRYSWSRTFRPSPTRSSIARIGVWRPASRETRSAARPTWLSRIGSVASTAGGRCSLPARSPLGATT